MKVTDKHGAFGNAGVMSLKRCSPRPCGQQRFSYCAMAWMTAAAAAYCTVMQPLLLCRASLIWLIISADVHPDVLPDFSSQENCSLMRQGVAATNSCVPQSAISVAHGICATQDAPYWQQQQQGGSMCM
jgi:hypothetical protein